MVSFLSFKHQKGLVMQDVIFEDWGRIDYQTAWEKQQNLLNELVAHKREQKGNPYSNNHRYILCEHSPVYTLGKSGSLDHLLLNETQLSEKEIQFFKINRGGDITYHGPGQIVGYPILDLDLFFNDVHKYVNFIEESIILTIKEYGLEGLRIKGYTGVWLPPKEENLPYRKICAIGVHLSRWVTMHGFAFNVNTELEYYDNIVPCGINDEDKAVTSMASELGEKVNIDAVKARLLYNFSQVFQCNIIEKSLFSK